MGASAKDIHVVVAISDGETEFWAAAFPRHEAVKRVRELLPSGWTAKLMEWQLNPKRVAQLKMRANSVQRLHQPRQSTQQERRCP